MQNDLAITVDCLSKRYRIGRAVKRAETLGQAMRNAVGAPFRYLQYRLSRATDEDTLWALKDVSFDVKRGEVVGVIGKNGAGKSTLLKILSRITDPTYGSARIFGRVNSLLEVGVGFHPELTGRENVFLSATLHGMKQQEIRGRFDEIVEFSGVEKFIDTPVKRYSSGMRVRLGFAVAAHLDPEILIVDEVLAVGDIDFQTKCLSKIEDITGLGRTVLIVSHSMATVKSLCKRAILLENGGIAIDGASDEVVARYLRGSEELHSSGHIPEDVPRLGTGEARFKRAELTDLDNNPVRELYLGQPFRVRLDFDVASEIPAGIIYVVVTSQEGAKVSYSSTMDGTGDLLHLQPGSCSVTTDLTVELLPGRYSLDLGICRRYGRSMVDGVQQTVDFSVLNVAKNGSDNYPWTANHGHVRAPSTWSGISVRS